MSSLRIQPHATKKDIYSAPIRIKLGSIVAEGLLYTTSCSVILPASIMGRKLRSTKYKVCKTDTQSRAKTHKNRRFLSNVENIRENRKTRHICAKSDENYVQRCHFASLAGYLGISVEIIGKSLSFQPKCRELGAKLQKSYHFAPEVA